MADISKTGPIAEVPVSEAVQEQIHFDTLWATAQGALALYAGQRWSARGDDDPGVTLLQAFAYGVSDVSYRHTLPLKDLLTEQAETTETTETVPSPRIHLEHEGSLFAPEFGPEWALTSSPVTLEDYRRAILDLAYEHNGRSRFCFRDVQIAPISREKSYGYDYDKTHYDFRFISSSTNKETCPRVEGGYQLYVTLTPGILEAKAKAVLQGFLKNHRNLCEWEIVSPVFVAVSPHYPQVRLLLEDDVPSEGPAMNRTIAQVIWAMNQALLPAPERQKATERLRQGERAEQVYLGPRLTHGWISRLPPERKVCQAHLAGYVVPLQSLSAAVTAEVPGVRAVEWFNDDDINVGSNEQVQLWVDEKGALALLPGHIQLYRRGQRVPMTANMMAAVGTEYTRLAEALSRAEKETGRRVPNGRHRAPGFYRTVGASLPPVYGLQQAPEVFHAPEALSSVATGPLPDEDARRLLQFMRPFEQLLANSADQLKKLPRLLAFDGRSPQAALWGAADWPQKTDDALAFAQTQQVFSEETRAALAGVLQTQSQDQEKELALLDHLLGYFGERRALRALNEDTTNTATFLHVQQGALRQATRLAYERASISISKVSALQRKIAARLGVGPELFDEALQKKDAPFPHDALPFYVIEHQELLPKLPVSDVVSSDWPKTQTATVNQATTAKDTANTVALVLTNSLSQSLQPGMLIELQGQHLTNTNTPPETLGAIVIHKVEGEVVFILKEQHARLTRSLPLLKSTHYTWYWRVAGSWLKRVVYDAILHVGDASKQGESKANAKSVTLSVGPSFPVELKKGVRFALRPKGRWLTWPTASDLQGASLDKKPDIVVEVDSADPLRGTVTVTWVCQASARINKLRVSTVDLQALPDNAPHWALLQDAKTPYAWSVPYERDNFSFTLSLVLNREWLAESQNPGELSRWIAQIAREEMPSHLNLQLHWLDKTDFNNFASKYQTWQNDTRPVGDQSYELLRLLGIGTAPVDERGGIGFARIVKRAESDGIEASLKHMGMSDSVHDKALQQAAVVYVRSSTWEATRDTVATPPPKKR